MPDEPRVVLVPGPALPRVLADASRAHAEPGWLRLTLHGNRIFDNPKPPEVRIDDYPVSLRYGETLVQVPAGPVTVDVQCRLLKRYGAVRLEVDVPAGETIPVFYAPPHHELAPGRIGHQPQRRAGVGAAQVLAIIAIVQLVLLISYLLD